MKKLFLKLLFIANLLVIFNFWYDGSGDFIRERTAAGILIALGRIAGLLSEYFILTQLVLIGRIKWIESQFGHSEMTSLHRTVGTYIAILLLSHPILLTVGWGMMTQSGYWEQFLSFLTNWEDVLSALFGLVIFIAAIILSLSKIRSKLRYERWHFTHLFMYFGIALAFGHQTQTGDLTSGSALYYWMVLNFSVFGFLLLYRFLKPFWLFYQHRFEVDRVVEESNDVRSIYIKGNHLETFDFKAGQFAELHFIKKGLWSNHPFSFSSAKNGKYLRFTVKGLGDFTNKVKELSPGTKVIIDGPLGNFTENESKTGKYLFIAGGVGITPIAGMIESLRDKNKLNDVCLLYCVRTATQVPFRDVFDKLPIKTYYIVSDRGAGDGGQNYISGYLDEEKIKKLCPSFKERDVYFCGPPKMGEKLIGNLHKMGMPKKQIHYEKFAF